METETNFAEKLEMFRTEIDAQAKAQTARLAQQAEKKADAAERIRAELAKREARSELAAQKSRLTARVSKELSRVDAETKRAVLAHRKELIEQFFEQTRQELCAFAQSAEYGEWLARAVKRAFAELGENAVISAAPRDIERVKALAANVIADGSVMIGGIRAQNAAGTLSGDYTLDSALEEEKQAFSQQSQLRLD